MHTNDAHFLVKLVSDLPGVKGGEYDRVQSPPARISLFTSPSQPSFTPSMFSSVKNGPDTGVGSMLHVDGGLLMELPDTDNGGVEGYTYTSGVPHSVSKERCWPSCWQRNDDR